MSRAYELDRAHVFHSWSAQSLIKPMVIEGAQGSYVWDPEGTRLVDFTSQLVFTNIGHQHPKVVAAIQEQAARLCTVAPAFANDVRSEAARLIVERAPEVARHRSRLLVIRGLPGALLSTAPVARHSPRRKAVLLVSRTGRGTLLAGSPLGPDPALKPTSAMLPAAA